MLRVLMTVDAVGGIWRYALNLTRSFAPYDVMFLLVGFGPPPQARQQEECAGLPNVELVWTDEPLDWTVSDPSLLDDGRARLAVLARQWRADLIHVNVPSQAFGLVCAQPIVAISHSCVPTWWAAVRGTPLPDEWAWHHDCNRRGLDRADLVVVPSEAHGRALARTYGGGWQCRIVHNAVPTQCADGEKDKLIVSVGRWWDDGKNGSVLDKAAPASPWPLILAGPLGGPHGEAVHFTAAETTGSLPHDEVQSLLARAAVFAAPSLYEPFGLAVAEAASAGAALVLSDIPTFRELWDGAALFVPPTKPERWAAAFQRLAADDALCRKLGAASKGRAATFSFGRQAERMWAVYQGLYAAAVL